MSTKAPPKTAGRPGKAKNRIISIYEMKRDAKKPQVLEADHDDYDPRPKTRSECENWVGPCPFVSCKYNLFLDVDERSGSIRINHPGLEIDELSDTCALEVADRGGEKLPEISRIINVSRQRASQIEAKALDKVKRALKGIDE